jgi:hypothetical protein
MLVLAILIVLGFVWAVRSANAPLPPPKPYAYEYSAATKKLTMKYPDPLGRNIDVLA